MPVIPARVRLRQDCELKATVSCVLRHYLRNNTGGPEKWSVVRALAALAKDLNWVPSTHIPVLTTICNCSSRLPKALVLACVVPKYKCIHIQIHIRENWPK